MRTLTLIYGAFILALVAVTVWAAFDVHHRVGFALAMQAPVLVLRVIWKAALRR